MITIFVDGPEYNNIAQLIGKAAFNSGNYAVSFSVSQNEQRSCVKIDKKPFTSRCCDNFDFVLTTSTEADYNKILEKSKEKSVLIANSQKKPASRFITNKKIRVKSLDISAISVAANSASLGPAILGVLVKECDLITLKGAKSVLEGPSQVAFDEAYKK